MTAATNMTQIPHKRGTSFVLNCETDVPITGWTIASQVRTPQGALLATLAVTITDRTPVGKFTLSCLTSTADWPVGTAEIDILYTNAGGVTFATNTKEIAVRRLVSTGA
jgi:hypothetical protein